MEQVSIGSGDGQTPSDHHGTTNLLNRLNFPAPTRGTVMQMAGNGVPGAVGQGRCSLLPGLQVPTVNVAGEIRQSLCSGSQRILGGSLCAHSVLVQAETMQKSSITLEQSRPFLVFLLCQEWVCRMYE